jgi:predicted Ser/Thr protein kinase
MNQSVTKLFPILRHGDGKLTGVQVKAILLLGPHKGGKSALFNWMAGRPMIGRKGFLGNYY